MKNYFEKILFILFLFLFMFNSTSATAVNSKYFKIQGFKGIAWNEPSAKYKHVLQKNFDDPLAPPHTERYTRKTDNLYFGKAYIGTVNYIFDDKGFISAQSEFEWNFKKTDKISSYTAFEQNIAELINECTQKWGSYNKTAKIYNNSTITTYIWQSINAIAFIEINRTAISKNEAEQTKNIIGVCLFEVSSIDGKKRSEKNLEEYRYNSKSNDHF